MECPTGCEKQISASLSLSSASPERPSWEEGLSPAQVRLPGNLGPTPNQAPHPALPPQGPAFLPLSAEG